MSARFDVETAINLLDTSFSASEVDEDSSEHLPVHVAIEEARNTLEADAGNNLADSDNFSGRDHSDVEIEVQGSAGPSGSPGQAGNEADPCSNEDINSDMELERNEIDSPVIDNDLEPELDEEPLDRDGECAGAGEETQSGTDDGRTREESSDSDIDNEHEGEEVTPKSRKRV